MSALLCKLSKRSTIHLSFSVCTTVIQRVKFTQCNPKILEIFNETFDLPQKQIESVLRKDRRLRNVTKSHIAEVVKVLEEFDISKDQALETPSVLFPNPALLFKRGKVLQECGVEQIKAKYLVIYFTLMRKKTVAELKDCNLLKSDLDVRKKLCQCFSLWDKNKHQSSSNADDKRTLYDLRLLVLKTYLDWRLGIKEEKFNKMVSTYNKFRHTPLADMERSISLAQNELQMTNERILANPFFICANPENTLMILNELKHFSGVDALEALKKSPSLIKEDCRDMIKIRNILKDHNMPENSGKRLLPLYLLNPEKLENRFKELEAFPEYQALSGNRRIPLLAIYKKRVVQRLKQYNELNKQCATIQSLVTCNSIYEKQMNSFGDKNVASDIILTIENRLSRPKDLVRDLLSRHTNWLHVSTVSIVESLKLLLQSFTEQEIFENCQIVLYSRDIIEKHVNTLINLRKSSFGKKSCNVDFTSESEDEEEEINHNQDEFSTPIEFSDLEKCSFEASSDLAEEVPNIDYSKLSNSQILAMALYLIERTHCFSGDGIWLCDKNSLRNNS